MSVRNLYHLLLALALSIPLSWGCTILFSHTEEDPQNNGYFCECGFEETSNEKSLNVPVVEGADDAVEVLNPSEGNIMTVEGEVLDLFVNKANASEPRSIIGLRFENIEVPAGALIRNAQVRFRYDRDGDENLSVKIFAESSVTPNDFLEGTNISERPLLKTAPRDDTAPQEISVDWDPPLTGNNSGRRRTPNLAPLIQPLIDNPAWKAEENSDSIVLVFKLEVDEGSTLSVSRAFRSFEAGNDPPRLFLDITPRTKVKMPICLPIDEPENEVNDLEADCKGRVLNTFKALMTADQCNFFSSPEKDNFFCDAVPNNTGAFGNQEINPDPNIIGFFHESCQDNECDPVVVDNECENLDFDQYKTCVDAQLKGGGNPGVCDEFVSATTIGTEEPVCTQTNTSMMRRVLGRDSTCELTGQSQIAVTADGGTREATREPQTVGSLTIQGCPGEECLTSFSGPLKMESVKFDSGSFWAKDPVFRKLRAVVQAPPEAVVGGPNTDSVFNSVNVARGSRRGDTATVSQAAGGSTLEFGVDWGAKTCTLQGNLLGESGDGESAGTCSTSSHISCVDDDPCPESEFCVFPEDDTATIVANVNLFGKLTNQPPNANAGADQTVECTSSEGATFTLDGGGSNDPDDNISIWSWHQGGRVGPKINDGLTTSTVTTSLGVGESKTYVLRVIDRGFQADVSTTEVSVVDMVAPTFVSVPPDIEAECTIHGGTPRGEISLGVATAEDMCDASPTVTDDAPALLFPLGDTTVNWTATDATGNASSETQVVTIVDTTPPMIEDVTPSPDLLWPPNHKMVPVSVSVTKTDICDPNPSCAITSVTSNEEDRGGGTGNTTPDMAFTEDPLKVDLRAERSGIAPGREYTIEVTCTDSEGNFTIGSTMVRVPHNR